MPRNRNVSAPNPARETADQDTDTAISPAPNDLPKATNKRDRDRLIKKSLEKGVFVTVLREGSVNGRTHTGVLHEVEPAGEGEDGGEAVYAIRTGQPGRPVKVTPSDIRTIVEAQVPVQAEDDE